MRTAIILACIVGAFYLAWQLGHSRRTDCADLGGGVCADGEGNIIK